ncbi:MAG: cytochrome c [Acidobacteria bacterium]|nr:cytochrome c [Acidobacteriota bacterium]
MKEPVGRRKRIGICCGVLLAAACRAWGQEPADFFRENCTSCHTIGGGRLTGPDLKGVQDRKEREWLVRFLSNPQAMLDSGDPYAQKLQQEARGVVMPAISGMNRNRAESLLNLIAAESKLEKSQFIGLQITDRPFTSAEIAQGKTVFLGIQHLVKGGPSCVSCHTARDLGGLGGGKLGPDLTLVFERLEGRKQLAAWLTAPPGPTMSPIFKRHALQSEEILPLVAFLEDEAKKGGEDQSAAPLTFLLLGLGGAAFSLVMFDSAWKARFRAVRKPLVLSSTHRGEE